MLVLRMAIGFNNVSRRLNMLVPSDIPELMKPGRTILLPGRILDLREEKIIGKSIVSSKLTSRFIGVPIYLIKGNKALGIVMLKEPKSLTGGEIKELRKEYGFEDLSSWENKTLYLYPLKVISKFSPPKAIEAPGETWAEVVTFKSMDLGNPKELIDEELLDAHRKLHKMWIEFSGSKEDILNYHILIVNELNRRKIKFKKYNDDLDGKSNKLVKERTTKLSEILMTPFPNEHSCRIHSPKEYERFFRQNCKFKHNGKCIDAVFGVKRGKSEIQAMRYPKNVWTASEASSHCKSKKGTFEPARVEKKSNHLTPMDNSYKMEFRFPLFLSERKETKEHFILEGFAAANDFDFQNDIISDSALRRASKRFAEEGKFCVNHTDTVIGKILDCHFRKGKIWVKTEITDPKIIDKVKSGEFNCLSIKGEMDCKKFERVFSPELNLTLKVVTDLNLEEVSLVQQGANPEAKAIRWYISKAIELAEQIMKKNLKEKSEELSETEENELEEGEEKEEEVEEKTEETEKAEEETEEEKPEGETEEKEETEEKTEDTEKEEEKEPEKEEEAELSEEEEEEEEEEGEEKKEEVELTETKQAAKWTTAFINDLPNSSFAYIEAGGKKDKEGKTVPRSLRHLPYKDASGKVDLPHLRNAIARAPHVKDKNGKDLSEGLVSRIQKKLQAILAGFKKEFSEEKTELVEGAWKFCVCPKCGYSQEHEAGEPCGRIKCPKCETKLEGSNSKALETEKELYVEKSAYTACIGREMKKGTPFKEATKICSKEAKDEGKAKKILRKKLKSKEQKQRYPFSYPYGYAYRYPKGTEVEHEKNLSENENEKVIYQVINSGDIKLGDGAKFKKELLRTGTWFHGASKDGVLEVTKDTIKKIIENFKNKVLDNVFIPLGHPASDDPSKNTGEVVGLEASDDGEKLMAEMEIKDKTVVEKIKKGLIKGISASIAENYMAKDTGKQVGATLFHTALVSEPYVKGMAGFVPLSETTKGSLIIPILNMEAPLTLEEIDSKIKKMEKKLRLSEDETSEEKTEETKEETKEETPEASEETSETSKEDELKPEGEETPAEETKEKETESSEGGEKPAEEEKETETEETKTEETESEAEEAKKGVDLAEAEKMYEELLSKGKVTPAEKYLLIPLLTSDTEIELSEDKKVASGKALYEYLKKQSPKFSLSENGTSETPDKKEKKEEIPQDINEALEKMNFSDEKDRKEIYKDFKKETGEKESTPF